MFQTLSRNRRYLVPGALLIAVLLLPLLVWLGAPLVRTDVVAEPFPFSVPDEDTVAGLNPDEAAAVMAGLLSAVEDPALLDDLSDAQLATLEETMMGVADRMGEHSAVEEMPGGAAAWRVVAAGTFVDADSFHQGSGSATIYAQGVDRILRLEAFMVTNGPDLHVLLVENIAGTSRESIGAYVDLGALKGNVGDQNYALPADVDLSLYSGVLIYCLPFHVVFATAPLSAP